MEFCLFLTVAIVSYRKIRTKRLGDPFTLDNGRFASLLLVLTVMFAYRFLLSLGLIDRIGSVDWTFPSNLTGYLATFFGTIRSLVFVVVGILGIYLFRSWMVTKGETMDREHWQELALIALGLFTIEIVLFYSAFIALMDTLFDQPEGGWDNMSSYVLIDGSWVFRGISFLVIGLIALMKARALGPKGLRITSVSR